MTIVGELRDEWNDHAIRISFPRTTVDMWNEAEEAFRIAVAMIMNFACECSRDPPSNFTICPLLKSTCSGRPFNWFLSDNVHILPYYPLEHDYSIDVRFLVTFPEPVNGTNAILSAVPREQLLDALRPYVFWLQKQTGLMIGTLPPRQIGGFSGFFQTWSVPIGVTVVFLIYALTRLLVGFLENWAIRQANKMKMIKEARQRRLASESSDLETSDFTGSSELSCITDNTNESQQNGSHVIDEEAMWDRSGNDVVYLRRLLAQLATGRGSHDIRLPPQATVVNLSPRVKHQFKKRDARKSKRKQVMMLLRNFR